MDSHKQWDGSKTKSMTEGKLPTATKQQVVTEEIAKDLAVIEKDLEKLKRCKDPWNKAYCETLLNLIKMLTRYRTPDYVVPKIGDLLIKYNFFDVAVKIWDHCHNSDDEDDNYLTSPCYEAMKLICWHYSEKCPSLCEEAYRHEVVIERFMREFNLPELSVEELTDNGKRRLIQATLGFLHNALRLWNHNRELVRKNHGIKRLLSFYDSKYNIIKALVMIVLAYCINEEENEKIVVGKGVITFIMKLMVSALKQPSHIGELYCFSASETVSGLNELTLNDSNQVAIVQAGVLPHLKNMMTGDKFPDEHFVAANCLWSLSFHPKNKEPILKEPGLMDAVRRLFKDPKSDKATRKSCEGILFILEGKEVSSAPQHTIVASSTATKHVMISYQWGSQPLILKLRDLLESNGLNVWLDVDDMEGSILDAMAAAVENASVIVVGVTEKYKNSNACRTEAEYAYKLKKPIAPLLLQPKYKADGWLGALLGMELYVAVSSEDDLSAKANDILDMVRAKAGDQIVETETGPSKKVPPSATKTDGSASIKALNKWSKNEVKKWAQETGIVNLTSLLSSYDGVALEQLVLLLKRSPDVYYNSLRIDLKLNLLQSLQLTSFVDKL